MEKTESDWSIESLYRQAWEIVKTYKVLWLLGIAAGAGSGLNLRSLSNFDSEIFSRFFQSSQKGNDSVLGDSTSILLENLSYLFSAVPSWVFVLLIVEAVIFTLAGFALAIIFQNWSEAALLQGIQAAIHKQAVSIRTTSEKALSNIIPLIKVTFLPYLVLGATILVVFPLLFIGLSSGSSLQGVFGLLMGIWLLVFIIAFLLLALTLIWATRAVVINRQSPMEALKHGYMLAKIHFWRMLGLGIVNSLASIVVIAIPIAVIAGIFAAAFLTIHSEQLFAMKLVITGGILIFAFIILLQLLGGIITAFKATVWSLAYQLVHKNHD